MIFSFTAPFLVRMTMVILRCLGFGGGHPMSFSHIVKQVRLLVLRLLKSIQAILNNSGLILTYIGQKEKETCSFSIYKHTFIDFQAFKMFLFKVSSFYEPSCGILHFFKIFKIFNTTSVESKQSQLMLY